MAVVSVTSIRRSSSRHHEGEIEEGMVFSVEAYVGVEGNDEDLKLEVLVTPDSSG